MINHVSIGVRDLGKARRFYDAVLAPLGYMCLAPSAGSLGYGAGAPALWINSTDHPLPAGDRSGLHFCFTARDRKSVEAFHAAGLATGGRDNGRPGLRADYGEGYYAAFLIDPDGYRIEAYFDESK